MLALEANSSEVGRKFPTPCQKNDRDIVVSRKVPRRGQLIVRRTAVLIDNTGVNKLAVAYDAEQRRLLQEVNSRCETAIWRSNSNINGWAWKHCSSGGRE